MIPQKAHKGQSLAYAQKQENKIISGLRVVVERAIGGAKRFKSFADIYRNKIPFLADQLMLISCGLWNLHIARTT